MNKIICRNSIR